MVGNTESGRKPGFKHSEKTIRQIRETKLGSSKSEESRLKISNSLRGSTKSEEHCRRISRSKYLYDLDGTCVKRYESLCAEYPGEEKFFEDNMTELLFAMQDIRTDKELSDIRRFFETQSLRAETPYQYTTTSCFAAEDVMIALLDLKRELDRRTLH